MALFTLRLATWLVGSSSNDSEEMTVTFSAFRRLMRSLMACRAGREIERLAIYKMNSIHATTFGQGRRVKCKVPPNNWQIL